MTAEEYARLRDSVAHEGLLEPITLHEGKILDGRHRKRACEETGTPVRTVELNGQDPLQFVLAKNLARRHLDQSQRAMIAARLADMKPGRPPKEKGGISPVSTEQAAKLLNVDATTVKHGKRVLEQGVPELVEACVAGTIKVSAARSCGWTRRPSGKSHRSGMKRNVARR